MKHLSTAGPILFWAAIAVAYVALPSYASLIAETAIIALFALSLDLVLGFAGILSLGHAAFFGLGAYTAGILTVHGVDDPLIGLVLAALVGGIAGLVTSPLVLRGSDLTRLMVTLGVASILYEVANRLAWLTGGADGLQGMNVGPLFGRFDFDLGGRVAAAYCLVVLFFGFLLVRMIVRSPFGWSLRAVRGNPLRASAVGVPVNRRLIAAYAIGAALAGVAGALLAQATGFVSLDVLAFHRSADVLLVLVIGGVGWLYGGIVGAVVFKVMQDALSALTPQYWQFWIGALLIAVVLIGRERLVPRAGGVTGFALQTIGLRRAFGALVVTDDVSLTLPVGARHALIGPNGAGKTTLINLLTGVLRPSAGQILLDGNDVTGLPPDARVRRGLARTFQINQLFAEMTLRENLGVAVAERLGRGGHWWRSARSDRAVMVEVESVLAGFGLGDLLDRRAGQLSYGQQRLVEISLAIACRPRVLLLDEPAAGVPESEREDILTAVAALPSEVTVLLIEHDMDLVFRFARSMSVLVAGAVLIDGDPAVVAADPRVREVYLGEGGHD